ncbi:MAG TPA: 23S rRNA (guanosine(2251)-2'-O)-methyltransferase RlmB [Candidatus Nanopelagicales bacterium]|nr:23S rRNA (guanosine(2251)-2'-O)-methyltransferase RlmB [Candidatus Nanopelagicales bacterium]
MRGAPRYAPAPRPLNIQDPSLALKEDEELVAGRRPVEEAFVARREAKRLLVVPQRRMALEKLVLHATSLRIPVVEVEGGTLTAIAGFDGHQGIALVVAPRRFASPDEILARAVERGESPLVLVLDSLEDPQNVGTLLRSAEATGVHGAVFPTHRQAPLSPAAIKASAGATEHLHLAPVDDLAGALADLHIRGLRIVGADGDAPLTAREADLRGPIAIVVGSEGRGLGPAVRRRCDLLVRIPMHGRIESLNAAVAGSILLYEAAAQRRLPESPLHPPADDEPESDQAPPPGPEPETVASPETEASPATEAAPQAVAPDDSPVPPEPPDEAPAPPVKPKRAPRAASSRAVAAEVTPAASDLAPPKRARRTPKAAPEAPPARDAAPELAGTAGVPDDDALLPGGPGVEPAANASGGGAEV